MFVYDFIYAVQSSFLSIYYLTMLSYLILILNFFFILFNINTFFLNSMELIKFIVGNKFYLGSLILSLLSLMGLPPLLGFMIKLVQLSFFSQYIHPIFVFLFIMYNISIIYFYVYIFKYLVEIKKDSIKPSKSQLSLFNQKFHLAILCLNSLNIFSLFFISHVFDFFQFISTLLIT